MPDTITLGQHTIGAGRRVFVIAEAGVNHNGDVELAKRLVDVAADAGADAVKFQTFIPDKLVAPEAAKLDYQVGAPGETESQLDMLRALVLPRSAYPELTRRAADRGLIFLSTPFEEESADFLEGLDVPAFKISSEDVINLPFLAHLARKRRPLLLSTGMATMAEVAAAVETVRAHGAPPLALLHCVSNYPTLPEDCNLRAMAAMRARFRVPTGWSDHTEGIDISIAAVALGAELLEKHFTLDRNLPGPDHKASLDPRQLRDMVDGVRRVQAAFGDGVKQPPASEVPVAETGRKSLHWRRSLPAGALVAEGDLIALRPGMGLSPARFETLIGRKIARAVSRNQMVAPEDFAPAP